MSEQFVTFIINFCGIYYKIDLAFWNSAKLITIFPENLSIDKNKFGAGEGGGVSQKLILTNRGRRVSNWQN